MLTAARAPYVSRINLSCYDRSPTVTAAERIITKRWAGPGTVVITKRQLPRLYAPLADVLLHDGLDRNNRLRSVKFVLSEVGRLGQAYWGWSEQRWIDIIECGPSWPGPTMTPQLSAIAYLLCGVTRFYDLKRNVSLAVTTRLVFGAKIFDPEADRLMAALDRVGFKCVTMRSFLPSVVAAVALEGGDPKLESFSKMRLEHTHKVYGGRIGSRVIMVGNGLAALGIAKESIRFRLYQSRRGIEADEVHPEWMEWCRRWLETSTLREGSRRGVYNTLMRVGIWLRRTHPEVTGPGHWTVDVCAAYLAAVNKLNIGDWAGSTFDYRLLPTRGKPLTAQSKVAVYQAMRRFLADVQSWEWTTLRCNPRYHLATPRTVLNLLEVNPRNIDDAVWLKLTWASLNLQMSDLSSGGQYPLELVKAIAVVWTHAGLRSNEIIRLRLGCARPQGDDIINQSGTTVSAGKLCWLDVPAGKTSMAYTKPVNAVVLTSINAWLKVRPAQRSMPDRRTGEQVDYLFQLRGRTVNREVVNDTLIPTLCAKAGVRLDDSRGRITSHRGRASAVTMLANVPQGMTVFELAKWCGHRSPQSVMSYVRSKPTQLASAFAKADEVAHMIAVVIDQEAITSGAVRDGAPWKHYDLGDSYCSNAFWSTCPHRMACAGCFFNVPKQSAKGLVLAAQQSATRLLEEVWLSPDERAAVQGDLGALEGMRAMPEFG